MSTPRGRPPKKRRGPDPQLTTSDGDIVGFRHLSVNSKRVYKREDPPVSPLSPEKETDDDLPVQNKVGRPPLHPEKGPMRESSLQQRRVELTKEVRLKRQQERKKDQLSEVRRQAVGQRRDRKLSDDAELEVEEDDQDNLDKDPSVSTVWRIKSEFSGVLPSSLESQMEVLSKIVEDGFLPELTIVDQARTSRETPRTSLHRYHKKVVLFVEKVKKKYSSFSHTLL